MKFTCIVDIDLPRDKVIEIFDNPDNMKHWQDGFISFKHLSGNPGEVGAKSVVNYENRGKPFELIETILVRDLPHEFTGTYEHTSMTNTMQNLFTETDNGGTRWTAHIEYTKLKGFMLKMMVFLMPSMFKKQVQKWMDQLKAFAEGIN